MSKLKATRSGKAGKHRDQLTEARFKARAMRIARKPDAGDVALMARLFGRPDSDEPVGVLAGIRRSK